MDTSQCRCIVGLWSTFVLLFSSNVFAHDEYDDAVYKYQDDGGWFTAEADMLAFPGPCNIDIVNAKDLSQKEFLSKYAFEKPVIIQAATDNSVFQDECRKERMMSKHSTKKIRLSSANRHSYDKADVTLKTYVESVMKPQSLETLGNETFYWFGDNNFTEWKSLIDLYMPPPYHLPRMTGAYSFGLAAAGTGVPFHFHGPGFGEVVFGRKRWFLYPPDQDPASPPNMTTLQWLHEDYVKLPQSEMPWECTIKKGEIIFFPDRWWHGTLNIDTSVFISTFLAA